MNDIWIAGFPSYYGGADTELDHNIDFWTLNNIKVHLVPMFGSDAKMIEKCLSRGCNIHKYSPEIFENKIIASFCNGEFLKRLPEIMEKGKPKKIIWFNCMTFTFLKEIEAHKKGWIDYFGFVSNYQKKWLIPELQKYNFVKVFEGYKPYFNVEDDMFSYNPPEKWFSMGRVSRDDGSKFSEDMWNIFYKVNSPIPTKTFVLGWGDHAAKKCGPAPNGLDWATYSPNSMPTKDFYRKLHCIIHKTGGSRESYCRIVPECYAHGVPIIVEDDYAFPELIIDGETGFRCKSSDEMSYRASQLAFDEDLRKKIIYNAKEHMKSISKMDINIWKDFSND